MIERFRDHPEIVAELLSRQIVIAGDHEVASAISQVGQLVEFPPEHPFITQDHAEDAIFFLLTGEATVWVNERRIAIRASGTYVGEMALIDAASPRSATVRAGAAGVVAVTVPAADFTLIADRYPRVWRYFAVELVHRLQQRGRFHSPPNEFPEIFIGSSRELLPLARTLEAALQGPDVRVRVWTDGVFSAGATTIESLVGEVDVADFAVLILGAEDGLSIRGEEVAAPRDNVIFELGLFIGAIGRERALILHPRGVDLHIPTDLLGITPVSYDPADPDGSLNAAGDEIRTRVATLGAK